MTVTEIRKQASEAVLRKLIAKGYGIDAAGRRAIEARVEAAVKRHVEAVDVRKREAEVDPTVGKIERAQGYAAALNDAIQAYAKAHNCSLARAADAVVLHPATSEYVRLDKQVAASQREAVMDRELRKLEGSAPSMHRTRPARRPPVAEPSEAGSVSRDDAQAADPDLAMTADEVLERLADVQQQRNPAMSRGRAVELASFLPEFTAAHRAEKLRKLW
jgi:hypothetical protein